MTVVTRLESVEQNRPRREDDGIGHENGGLLGRKPAHVAERQLEAALDEPEEQHVDVLQVIPHSYDIAALVRIPITLKIQNSCALSQKDDSPTLV